MKKFFCMGLIVGSLVGIAHAAVNYEVIEDRVFETRTYEKPASEVIEHDKEKLLKKLKAGEKKDLEIAEIYTDKAAAKRAKIDAIEAQGE